MGNLKGVGITKGRAGANSAAPSTSASAIIGNWASVPNKFVPGTCYKVTSVKQAETELGITNANDILEDQILHRHIVDFFSMAGEGTAFYILSVFGQTGATSPALVLEDANATLAKTLVVAGAGKIRQVGVCWNVATGVSETTTDGFSTIMRAALPKAQLFADWTYDTERPVHVVLEARAASATLSTLIDLRNIQINSVLLECPQVSLALGQDWDYAESRALAYANTKTVSYAAVGKVLGTIAAAEMNQSIAEVATFNLSDAKRGYFLTGGLSNHKKITEVEASLQLLHDKGYIFAISYNSEAVSGLRWNGDHTCVPVVVDADGNINEHTIYYSRTLSECARALRNKMLFSLKTRVPANTETGLMTTGAVKLLEAEGDYVFDLFKQFAFISGGKTFVDATSDLVQAPKQLKVDFEVVPTLIIDNIAGTVRLKKSITV